MKSNRDQPDTLIRYFNPEIPRDETITALGVTYRGLLTLGEVPGGSKEDYKKRRDRVVSEHSVTLHNARGSEHGDLPTAWDLAVNGFTFVPAAMPIADFHNRAAVRNEYGPRLSEIVEATTGANRAFLVGQQVRTEQTGRGISSASYARFAHSDYGPEYEPIFRRLLSSRYGLSKDEAENCGICLVGYWAPIERPAYRDPLCLLDSTSVDLEKEMVRYIYQFDGELHYSSKRPLEKRLPVPAQDAPAIAPVYSPNHRWFFAPDMSPEEAVIFKQYDCRENMEARACWHNSFHDTFHDGWQDCPGRRSIEIRLLLTFDGQDSFPEMSMRRQVSDSASKVFLAI